MTNLNNAISRNSMSIMTMVLIAIPVITLPFLIHRLNKMQRAVAVAIDNFNREVLEKKGVYAKTQKSILQVGKHHEEVSWLSISLNRDDAVALRGEEHVFFYNPITKTHTANDGCCKCTNSCCGVPQVI
eukprot:m.13797 g.13797  ORF g.13797 m.13797 type:complete len:129 (-) comp7635_c0_seq1:249-635(-)